MVAGISGVVADLIDCWSMAFGGQSSTSGAGNKDTEMDEALVASCDVLVAGGPVCSNVFCQFYMRLDNNVGKDRKLTAFSMSQIISTRFCK
jgi:hypothetical protein